MSKAADKREVGEGKNTIHRHPTDTGSEIDGRVINGSVSISEDGKLSRIPITLSIPPTDRYSIVMFVQFIGASLITLLSSWWFFDLCYRHGLMLLWFAVLPFHIYGSIYLFVFTAAVLAYLIDRIFGLSRNIEDGIFPLNGSQFRKYRFRYWNIYFPVWAARAVPLPWVDFVIYKMLGTGYMGKSICLYDSWMDVDGIDVEDHVMTSLNTVLMSNMIYKDKYIRYRVILKKNAITGAQSVVAPGTVVDENATLGAASGTYIKHYLKGMMIHTGSPINRSTPVKVIEESGHMIKLNPEDMDGKSGLKKENGGGTPSDKN